MHNLLNKSSNRNGYRLEEIGRKIIGGEKEEKNRGRGGEQWRRPFLEHRPTKRSLRHPLTRVTSPTP